MFRKILLAAVALATVGTSIAAQAYPGERHDRREVHQDRRDVRHDRREVRRDRREIQRRYHHRGRDYAYYHGGRYYNERSLRNGVWIYR